MAIVHDGNTFPVFHDAPRLGKISGYLRVGQWPATIGETHQVSGPFGRDITCEVTWLGYASEGLLQAAIDAVEITAYRLQGALTIGTSNFPNCTYLGYQEQERFLDGSGVNGWQSQGLLTWRQASLILPP